MNISGSVSTTSDIYPGLHFMDGTGSQGSYAAIARRGSVFLGIRLLGLMDSIKLGVPGKTYLHARVRSARSHVLAQQLDLEAGAENVVNLSQHQLALDAAWPNLTFEKVDEERASLLLGVFIDGSFPEETDLVVDRLEKADLFRKFVDYLINRAGPEYRESRGCMVVCPGRANP